MEGKNRANFEGRHNTSIMVILRHSKGDSNTVATKYRPKHFRRRYYLKFGMPTLAVSPLEPSKLMLSKMVNFPPFCPPFLPELRLEQVGTETHMALD